jgi:hypothetical protein
LDKKLVNTAMRTTLVLGLFLLAAAARCRAQATPSPQEESLSATDGVASGGVTSDVSPAPVVADQPPAADLAVSVPLQASTVPDDDGWHLTVSPYLWFPGVHGTIGAFDRSATVHVSPSDLLSHFRFGVMGVVEPRYNNWIMPIDVMWVRLGENNALPGPLGAVTANVTASDFILTPKVGYRVVNDEKFKFDALAGFRYWHFGESLSFTPSALGLNFSASQNWVDPVVGARFEAALSPKVSVTLAGDVGGWGVSSQQDYQIVSFLGYKMKPTLTLGAGYRYLDVNRRSGGSVVDLTTSGVFFGGTIILK